MERNMKAKQIVKEFLDYLDGRALAEFGLSDGTTVYPKELRDAIKETIRLAMEDGYKEGYKQAECDNLFETSTTQTDKEW